LEDESEDQTEMIALTSTQIGVIGENLLVNAVMKASNGRLSPFQPLADDDGLDVLFYDKLTGNSVALQLKCRTVTLFKPGTKVRGGNVHFEVRKSTMNEARKAYLVAALFNDDLSQFVATWFIPMEDLVKLARSAREKWVIRPNTALTSKDRCAPYRCMAIADLANRITALCE
jgi:hypothetical protein